MKRLEWVLQHRMGEDACSASNVLHTKSVTINTGLCRLRYTTGQEHAEKVNASAVSRQHTGKQMPLEHDCEQAHLWLQTLQRSHQPLRPEATVRETSSKSPAFITRAKRQTHQVTEECIHPPVTHMDKTGGMHNSVHQHIGQSQLRPSPGVPSGLGSVPWRRANTESALSHTGSCFEHFFSGRWYYFGNLREVGPGCWKLVEVGAECMSWPFPVMLSD